MALLGLAACLLLAMGGCARLVTAPTAEPEVGTSAAYTVLNGEDSGAGSLRQVVADAPAEGIVTFDASVTTVTLTSGHIVIDKDLTIAGPEGGTVTVSGNDASRVFFVATGGVHAVFENLTIAHGRADFGAGLRVDDAPTTTWSWVTLRDCTVAENVATGDGGGLNIHGGLVMERTTVRDNRATGSGGGLLYYGPPTPFFSATGSVVNSTFTGNYAGRGGAMQNAEGLLSLAFTTITANESQFRSYGAGVSSTNDGAVETRFRGTIVVGNTSQEDGSADDLYALYTDQPFVSQGYNLIGVGNAEASVATAFTASGDDTGVSLADVALQTLADNGGPTQTLALGVGSQAIDAVPPSDCLDASGVALGIDQRGVTRPQGTDCDIGAFEATPVSYVVTSSADDGAGSLRQIVGFAPPGATITFDPLVSTVLLTSGQIVIDKDLTIAGPEDGTVTIDAAGASRVLDVKNGGHEVVLRNLTITGGYADLGGGVWVESGASLESSLTLIDCTVADNHAGGNEAVRSDGGGLYVNGTLRMERTTVRGNTAGGFGGGVFHQSTSVPSAHIVNSTFTGNVGQVGGAIHNDAGEMTIAFSTITGNQATLTLGGGGGGVSSYNDGGSETRLLGTIVVGNTDKDDLANDLHRLFSTQHFVTLGYNLVGTASGFSAAGVFVATGDVAGLTDVGLQPLADNGGPTQTLALGAGSQAIDAVPPSDCLDAAGAALAIDQRGVSRPQSTNCDIGAFELVPAPPPPVTYVVSDGGDSGTGTLRQILLDAPAGTTITFAPEVTTVYLTSGSLVLGKDVTIAGPEDGTVTIRGDGATFRVIYIGTAGVQVTLRNLTITDGYVNGSSGGGIAVEAWDWDLGTVPSPSLRLERCSVVGNYASQGGGGLSIMGDLFMDATSVSGNATGAYGWGGGLVHYGTDLSQSVAYPSAATIVNSTISGNTAYKGGAIDNEYGSLRILFSTITGNTATSATAGGILSWNDSGTRTTLKGTIVVGNTASGAADDVHALDTANRFDSRGYNVIGVGTGDVDFTQEFTATGDLTSVAVADAGLLALGDNGGPTQTHALNSASVALNHVPAADCTDLVGTTLLTDQRGVLRPQGSQCDSGAFEYDGTITAYVLNASATPEAAGTVAGAGTYEPGATATLTATPADHWAFSHWSGDLSGSDNPATVTMDANKTVVANFTQVLYAVTETLDGGGTVLREPAGSAYPYGTTVTVTAVPTDEWHFDQWSGVVTGSSLSESFVVTGPTAYTAHFIRWYPLTVEVVGNGGVARNPSGESYQTGTVVTLTATPDASWRFDGWSGDLTGSVNPTTITMDAAKTVTATFVPNVTTYTVTTHVDGAGSVDGGGTYASGATAKLTAVPFPGAAFDYWSGDATGSTNPIELTVTSNLDVTAHFVLAHTLDVTVEGEGEVTTDPSVGPYADGTVVTLTATPAPGWFFQMWTGSVTGSVNPVTLEMRDSEGVTAIFQPVLGPMLSVAIEGEGLVTSEPTGIHCRPTGGACLASYPKNTRVTLYAVADDGSAFLRWSGSTTDTAPDLTIRLREDAQATAHFTELNGPVVAIDRTGSFRGNTAIVTGSLVCAAGSTYDLDVSILQEVPVKKDMPQLVSASTTVIGAACGQTWTATLVAEDARFVRGDAEVTVTVDGVSKTVLVQLR